jgi:hypothetical protein
MLKMKSNKSTSGWALCAAAVVLPVLFASQSAFAALGGDVASITADQKAMDATLTSNTESAYVDYVLMLKNGIVVHEFVSAGQVFQVTWSGKGAKPDMNQLLGKYASSYPGNDGSAHSPTERNSRVERSDFVMHSSVQNRFFSGSAHVPDLLPVGMQAPLNVPHETKRLQRTAPSSSVSN